MPIFISYSRKDRHFVDMLSRFLVRRRHHVWLDQWELNVGDSLVDKIQAALRESSAILVVLSKSSTSSQWCKKELNAGLIRELEERKSILMPCVVDDCEIPLFLREKFYADFRSDPDQALHDVDRALDAISNPLQARLETPDFHIDWSVSWGNVGDTDRKFVEFTFVDHSPKWPYIIMSQCKILFDAMASKDFSDAEKKGNPDSYIRDLTELVVDQLDDEEMTTLITDARPKFVFKQIKGVGGQWFDVEFSCRRMGTDNGMDTVYYLDKNIHRALSHMKNVAYKPPSQNRTS